MSEEALPAVQKMQESIAALKPLLPTWSEQVQGALATGFASPDDGHSWPVALVTMIVAGIVVEAIANLKLRALLVSSIEGITGTFALCSVALVRVAFDFVGLFLFWGACLLALNLLVESEILLFSTLDAVLAAIIKVRGFAIVVRAIFAPRNEHLRLLSISTEDAFAFYRWLVAFSMYYSGIIMVMTWLYMGGMDPLLARFTNVVIGSTLAGMFVLMVTVNRKRIARQFKDSDKPLGKLGQLFAKIWPLLLSLWMGVLCINWARATFLNDLARNDAIMLAWWVTLLFPLVDRLFYAMLNGLMGTKWVVESAFAKRADRFVSVMQTGFRILLVAVALFAVAVAWEVAGVSLLQSDTGRHVLMAVIDIGITLLFAYVLFEVVVAILDAKMPAPDTEDAEMSDGEGGGAGATRGETLAPLIRGTFIVLLVVIVLLTVLSSLGLEVAPLLAGAGVFGIAIGFGAQKLVQDVISGLFFLVDDAFRRGEYIDVGAVKGTVEKISIRSMQLRHHMGNLHTIPFGEIRYLTNFSRDWVMMKLKLRLAYGTDPERVRKLVKKLGQELLQHPEIGEKFMEPLKSQGVFSMEDDSAMIYRVKFMTKPGDQFVVRKTVYAAIHDRFEKEGIYFAHRVVTVKVEDERPLTPEATQKVAGAALPAIDDGKPAPAGGDAR